MKKAIYLDSNVFIRLIIGDVQDHLEQSRRVFHRIENGEATGNVSILVLNEVIWILEHFYELKRKTYIPQLLSLLALKEIKIVEADKYMITKILKKMQQDSFDFTDHYLSEIATPETLFSFDRDFQKIMKK